MKLQIDEHADLRGLAFNMVRRALADLKNTQKPEKQADALMWLTGPDFGVWCEVWGMPYADPWQMLTSGAAKNFKPRKADHDQ